MKRTIYRFATTLLLSAQVFVGVPLVVEASSAQVSTTEPPVAFPPRGSANRTLPSVKAPQVGVAFSETPTEAEVFHARVFPEPLVPIATPSVEETKALANAILAYSRTPEREDMSAFVEFLSENPGSSWRASVLANLGSAYRRTGYFTKSLAAALEAWSLAKDIADPHAEAVAGIALGELAELHARLGHRHELADLIAEADKRVLAGPVAAKVAGARQGLAMMVQMPEYSYRCGPLAVGRVLAAVSSVDEKKVSAINGLLSTDRGTNLAQLRRLAQSVGLKGRPAFRESSSTLPIVPAVIHWKAGHFAAVVREIDGRYLISDPTFGEDTWVSRRALAEETTGYVFAANDKLPEGWRDVPDREAANVWGKGHPTGTSPNPQGPGNPHPGGNGPTCGMATYRFNYLLASLRIDDIPLSYDPPRGPAVRFQPTYLQFEQFQPVIPYFSNLGRLWTFDWLSWIEDAPDNPQQTLMVFERGGGLEELKFDSVTDDPITYVFGPNQLSQAVVVRVSTNPIRYERRLPDGRVDVYDVPDAVYGVSRRVFLSESRDLQGDVLRFTYDDLYRLVALTDAVGQVTTLSYGLTTDPYRITQVTDPFGRSARITYDSTGRVEQITDVLNLSSKFTYGGPDFMTSMTTPYGTTSFEADESYMMVERDPLDPPGDPMVPVLVRSIQATDPMGGKERVEFRAGFPNSVGIPKSDPEETVPTEASGFNNRLDMGGSLYWDKRAMAIAPDDASAAEYTLWTWTSHHGVSDAIIIAVKRPLQARVWNAYKVQSSHEVESIDVPTVVGHVLDDGTFNLTRREHNRIGKVIKEIDPVGNETVFVWGTGNMAGQDPTPEAGSGMDLLQVKRKQRVEGGGYDIISETTYDTEHRPLTTTDAAGKQTTYTYTAKGQLATVETPERYGPDGQTLLTAEERTTTYAYFPDDALFGPGRLASITGPGPTAVTTYTYDGYGRVKTTTDLDGYTLKYEYDAMDRPTKTIYPDQTATFEETTYNRLDAEGHRDRQGRWTRTFYDNLRRKTAVRDPLGRTTTYAWCDCGSLDKIIDANGNETRWEYDLAGRVIKETRADGSYKSLVYDGAGRIKKRIDAKQQEIQYTYAQDGKLLSTSYVNSQHPTPGVTLSYTNPATGQPDEYGRLRQMVDGTGSTTYAYRPMTGLGAGQLASVDGPLADDTVSYLYDELGRVKSRTLGDGSPTSVESTWVYDFLGRLYSHTDPIGTFGYTYDGVTERVTKVTYPNGQSSNYSYLPSEKDHRLEEIHHKRPAQPGDLTLSKFNYTYDSVGNIKTWSQQADSNPAQVHGFEYDLADQLVAATVATPAKRYRYAYDPAGNRTAEQIDDAVTGASYDKMNRLLSQQPGGTILFKGTTPGDPSRVTVQGKPAATTDSIDFAGRAEVGAGQTDVVVQATDFATPVPNTRTKTYRITQSGSTTTFAYDLNGNLTSDAAQAFEWDAENRLAAIVRGNHRSEFTYDGFSRRVRIIEKDDGSVTSDKRYLWCGLSICEQRDGAGTTVQRRFFKDGFQEGTAKYYYAKDHLGSIRDTTDNSGTLQLRLEFDPYGRPNAVAGSQPPTWSTFGYTGHLQHWGSGVIFAPYRGYLPAYGRWMSEDPIGIESDHNLYRYVFNRPTGSIDRLGLCPDKQPCEPCYYQKWECHGCTCLVCSYRSKSCPTDNDDEKRVYCTQLHRPGCEEPSPPDPKKKKQPPPPSPPPGMPEDETSWSPPPPPGSDPERGPDVYNEREAGVIYILPGVGQQERPPRRIQKPPEG